VTQPLNRSCRVVQAGDEPGHQPLGHDVLEVDVVGDRLALLIREALHGVRVAAGDPEVCREG
jgi:hypothetical protein